MRKIINNKVRGALDQFHHFFNDQRQLLDPCAVSDDDNK
jgi:hypothetical protein